MCLPSVTQCSKRDVVFGLDQKKSSLRLKSVTLWQKIGDFGLKYTQEQFKRRNLNKWIDGRGKRIATCQRTDQAKIEK